MNEQLKFVTACVAAAVLPWMACADSITLRNGRTLSGAITSQTSNEYIIKTDIGALKVSRNEVTDIRSDGTTSEEVDGDVALSKKNYDDAARYYQAAVKVAPDPTAKSRVEQKLARITQLTQQRSDSALVQQIQQAGQLYQARRLEEAQRILEGLLPRLADDEVSSAARRTLADIYYANAMRARDSVQDREMERQLKMAIEVYEPHVRSHLMFGELLLRSSVTEKEGIAEILKGLQYGEGELSEEERVRYHYMLGKRYFDKGEFEQAASHFAECQRAKGTYGAYADAMQRAVQSYIKMGEKNIVSDFQKTIDALNEALRLTPDNKDALFLLGRIYKDTGQTDNAIAVLKKVVALDDKYPQAHHFLAQAYIDKRDYFEALKHLDAELLNDPTNYDALSDRAEVRINLAEHEKAQQDLQAAQRVEPNRWRAYLLASQLAYAQEKYEEAQQNLVKVLQIKPDAIEAHIQMGKVLMAQKTYDKAKEWFNNVVQYLEKSPRLSYRYKVLMAEGQTDLGTIDFLQDSPRQAETRFRQALEFMPNFAPAFNRIGDVKRRLGDEATDKATKEQMFREAEQFYMKAIAAEPRNPNFYLSLGILYHKNIKDTQNALVNYRKYLELGGRDQVNVNKWIEEVTTGVSSDDVTTGTAVDGGTTGTETTTGTAEVTASATDISTETVSSSPATTETL